MLVRGVPVRAGGIGSVATQPETLGRGLATALLKDALGVMRREGMAVSFLFTGIPGFYDRLGYRLVWQPQFEAPARDVASIAHSGLYDIRQIAAGDTGRLLAIHKRGGAGTTGAVVRTRRTWRDATHWLGERDGDGWAAERNGRPVAYLRSRCRAFGHQVIEAECLPGHDGAVAALLAAAGRRAIEHGEQVVALAPDDHPLATALRTLPTASETTDVGYPMMLRIVSLDALLADLTPYLQARARSHSGTPFALRLHAPGGEQATLDVSRSSLAVRRRNDAFALDEAATLDVLFGQRRASRAVRPRPPAGVARRIDALLPASPLHFWNADRI
jgi:hypothetical protein